MIGADLDWSGIWKIAQAEGHGLAMWRLPNQDQQFLLKDVSGGQLVDANELENLGAGFLVGPFIGQPYFLKASTLLSKDSAPEKITPPSAFRPSEDLEKSRISWNRSPNP